MAWMLEDTLSYYKSQGAPADQSALIAMLKEIQLECGGRIPKAMVAAAALDLGVKEGVLLALIRRIPSLQLSDTHLLELCAGPNCGKSKELVQLAEESFAAKHVQLKYVPCMRLCGKGPNIRLDGKIYHHVSTELLRQLLETM